MAKTVSFEKTLNKTKKSLPLSYSEQKELKRLFAESWESVKKHYAETGVLLCSNKELAEKIQKMVQEKMAKEGYDNIAFRNDTKRKIKTFVEEFKKKNIDEILVKNKKEQVR